MIDCDRTSHPNPSAEERERDDRWATGAESQICDRYFGPVLALTLPIRDLSAPVLAGNVWRELMFSLSARSATNSVLRCGTSTLVLGLAMLQSTVAFAQ